MGMRKNGEAGSLHADRKPQFPGRRTAISGLRYYNPFTGRWLSRDPIGERGGVNLYATVKNNTVDRYDYLGMHTLPPPAEVDAFTIKPQGRRMGEELGRYAYRYEVEFSLKLKRCYEPSQVRVIQDARVNYQKGHEFHFESDFSYDPVVASGQPRVEIWDGVGWNGHYHTSGTEPEWQHSGSPHLKWNVKFWDAPGFRLIEHGDYPAIMIFEARTTVVDAATFKELASLKWMVIHDYTAPGKGRSSFKEL